MDHVPIEELDKMLTAMIQSAEGISDLLFVVGKPPQVEVHGALEPAGFEWSEPLLTSQRIESLAGAILNHNSKHLRELAEHGSCDCSYALGDICRFRVNVYRQNGSYAMVLRRLQSEVPSLESLGLPPIFHEIVKEKNGLIFVTGASGNGKTTTLAALLNEINRTCKVHVVSLEDPIEFLHPQLRSTFSQRELGRDFFSFPDGLRAALRQAPKVILVGEIRDRETMDIALTAGETGHLVFSTLHTISADQTIHRVLGLFSKQEEQQVRERLAGSLRYIVGQRLVPKNGGGRHLVTELMGSSLRTREAIALGENENRRLHEIIEAASSAGWHSFEQSLLKARENDFITEETAMLYCVNKPAMRQRLDLARSHNHRAATATAGGSSMMVVPAATEHDPHADANGDANGDADPALVATPMLAPAAKPAPQSGFLHGFLNGII
jgi:twitching motility protein PilT